MVKTARVPAEALAMNRTRVRGFPLDLKQVRAMVDRFNPTALTLETVANMSETVEALPCAGLHPWVDSCRETNIDRFIGVTKTIFPVYATLNFVPLVVLRMKRLLKEYVHLISFVLHYYLFLRLQMTPQIKGCWILVLSLTRDINCLFYFSPVNVLSKTTFNTLRSSAFLAVFVALYQTQICTHRNLLNAGWKLGNSKYLYWLFGLVSAVSAIMVEQESRRAELAFYVIPKAADSLYRILYRKNWVKGVRHWEVMTFSFAMSLVMVFCFLFCLLFL